MEIKTQKEIEKERMKFKKDYLKETQCDMNVILRWYPVREEEEFPIAKAMVQLPEAVYELDLYIDNKKRLILQTDRNETNCNIHPFVVEEILRRCEKIINKKHQIEFGKIDINWQSYWNTTEKHTVSLTLVANHRTIFGLRAYINIEEKDVVILYQGPDKNHHQPTLNPDLYKHVKELITNTMVKKNWIM